MPKFILFSALIFGINAISRSDLFNPDIQIDEPHWAKRAKFFIRGVTEFNEQDIRKALTHPGLTFNAFIFFSLPVCTTLNLDVLNCGRLLNVFLFGVALILLFQCLTKITSAWPAFFSTLAILFSPNFFGLSQINHIDTVLFFVICLTFLLSFKEDRLQNWLLQGAILGLGALNKISFFVFIFSFLLTLIALKRPVIKILTINIACLLTFLVLPTLWHQNYRYSLPLKLDPSVIQAFSLTLTSIFFALSVYFRRDKNLLTILTLSGLVCCIWLIKPFVFINVLSTFWRLFELKSVPHEFKYEKNALEIITSNLTFFDLIACLVAVIIGLTRIKEKNACFTPFILSLVLAISIFSLASKLSFRYFFPFLAPLIAVGLAYLSSVRHFKWMPFLAFAFNLLSWYSTKPCYLHYRNRLLDHEIREEKYPTCYVSQALNELPSKGFYFAGQIDWLKAINQRLEIKKNFSALRHLGKEEFILVAPGFEKNYLEYLKTENLDAFKEYQFQNSRLLKIYRRLPIKPPIFINPKRLFKTPPKCVKKEALFCYVFKNNKPDFHILLEPGVYIMEGQVLDYNNFLDVEVQQAKILEKQIRFEDGHLYFNIKFSVGTKVFVRFSFKIQENSLVSGIHLSSGI